MGGGRIYGRTYVVLNQSDLVTDSRASLPLEVGKNVAEADGEFGASGRRDDGGVANWDGKADTCHQSQRFTLFTERRTTGK